MTNGHPAELSATFCAEASMRSTCTQRIGHTTREAENCANFAVVHHSSATTCFIWGLGNWMKLDTWTFPYISHDFPTTMRHGAVALPFEGSQHVQHVQHFMVFAAQNPSGTQSKLILLSSKHWISILGFWEPRGCAFNNPTSSFPGTLKMTSQLIRASETVFEWPRSQTAIF